MFVKSWTRIASALVIGALCDPVAHAQDYPSRPITIVVPWNAGASMDFATRTLAKQMSEAEGWNVVVENRAGASGTIGSSYVARADPDGYTLILGNGTSHGANKVAFDGLIYDPVDDFRPISAIMKSIAAIAVPGNSEFDTLQELIDYAKANPGKLKYGVPGLATQHFLIGEAIKREAGVDIPVVPYTGGGAALQDVLGGHLPIILTNVPTVVEHHKAGKVKILAIADGQRFAGLPDVPTVSELYPSIVQVGWAGIFAPKDISDAVAERLNKAVVAAVESPTFKEAIENGGLQAISSTPDELAKMVTDEIANWEALAASGVPIK